VIPLGDLWDVGGPRHEAFTDVMRLNFENAKRLYQQKLRPMLEESIGHRLGRGPGAGQDGSGGRRQGPRGSTTTTASSRGLLLCALVHGVETLKNMTCMKLAAPSTTGTVRSPIPNREHQTARQQGADVGGG